MTTDAKTMARRICEALLGTIPTQGQQDCVEKVLRESDLYVQGESKPCQHTTSPSYTHCTCTKCGMVLTDGGWGIASRKWFKNLHEAEFYRDNGRYPQSISHGGAPK